MHDIKTNLRGKGAQTPRALNGSPCAMHGCTQERERNASACTLDIKNNDSFPWLFFLVSCVKSPFSSFNLQQRRDLREKPPACPFVQV